MITIKKILCPVDFFPASEGAAMRAARIAADYDATLKLLHVVSPILSSYKFPLNRAEAIKSLEQAATRKMKKLIERIEAVAGIAIKSEIRAGNVQNEIKRAVDRDKPDLIVMGTHGHHGIERWFLGSVTESLLRHSPVPLLTVSPASKDGDRRVSRILVTTDFSDGTADALAYAFSIAQENQARVDLLHVVEDVGLEIFNRYGDPFLKNIRKKLEGLVPRGAKNWCEVRTRVESGKPYRVILKILEREKPDLLVMNIHGKNRIDRALLGTTAERVVRAADCPVLLIPPLKKPATRTSRKKGVA
jgi:nucleotide-binding universal stress UspA family protein